MKTTLSADEARAVVRAFGLALEEIEPLPAHGTVNSNFRLRASGQRWFLRLNEGKTDEDVVCEAALIAELADRDFPTPRMRQTPGGEWFVRAAGRQATLFPFLDGSEASPRDVRVCGRALGLLHVAGATIDSSSLPRNHYSLDELERRLASFAADPRLADVVPKLRATLARAPGWNLPSGLIHQDLFPDNLLVDANGELVAVLDFEQACFGVYAYDLAVAINAWCWDGARLDEKSADALLAEYRQVRPVGEHEAQSFPELARLAAARFTITRITDVFLRPGVDPDLARRKDFRDYLRRLDYWSGECWSW